MDRITTSLTSQTSVGIRRSNSSSSIEDRGSSSSMLPNGSQASGTSVSGSPQPEHSTQNYTPTEFAEANKLRCAAARPFNFRPVGSSRDRVAYSQFQGVQFPVKIDKSSFYESFGTMIAPPITLTPLSAEEQQEYQKWFIEELDTPNVELGDVAYSGTIYTRMTELTFATIKPTITDRELIDLDIFQLLHKLSLKNTSITDQGLWRMTNLDPYQLSSLDLSGTWITTKGIKFLCIHLSLCELNLSDINLKGVDFRPLQNSKNLRNLNLTRCNLTDRELSNLSDSLTFPHNTLTSLYIDGNEQITDKGLIQLARFTQLNHLSLENCPNITDAAIQNLKGQIPGLEVVR